MASHHRACSIELLEFPQHMQLTSPRPSDPKQRRLEGPISFTTESQKSHCVSSAMSSWLHMLAVFCIRGSQQELEFQEGTPILVADQHIGELEREMASSKNLL